MISLRTFKQTHHELHDEGHRDGNQKLGSISGKEENQGPLIGGVSNGVSRSGLVLPFLSFLGLFLIFPGFSRFLPGDRPGIFPICPFPLSRPMNSTYEEQSRKGLRHNPDLSQKKGKPQFGNPLV